MLATYSLLPIAKTFTSAADINLETRDISVAGRVIAYFSEYLNDEQKQTDDLALLGKWCLTPHANIIKLPNISASLPQLLACIEELQGQGYDLPPYPSDPKNNKEREIKTRYQKAIGSAVNPVLREGNSDRRVAEAVKNYAKKHPHKLGKWNANIKTHVSHMTEGDYYGSEQSVIMTSADTLSIELHAVDDQKTVLKSGISVQDQEVVDTSVMSCGALRSFFEKEMQDAKSKNMLWSLHLKATMMKVSDPIFFGHAVKVYYKDVFEKYDALFEELGVNANNGIGDVYAKIANHAKEKEIKDSISAVYKSRPELAMVNSDEGITNLHVPSDIIIDASMPVVVRDSGCMWTPGNKLAETKCCIPDRCYAGVYQAVFDFCRGNGQFDVCTMGNVPNVGLMAQKAEEYGSHDKTFEVSQTGVVKVVSKSGKVLMEQKVTKGDVFRMCQVKNEPIKDWIMLAVKRSKAFGAPAVFWLDPKRAHDRNMISKVEQHLNEFYPKKSDRGEVSIMSPIDACVFSMKRAKDGLNTISVTGNVLRDYLTDLFPILELGTSAKMLSIVPMLAGGGMYETGAGGSAPKHVQQFVQENHLRWDSLGEFLALAISLEELSLKCSNAKGTILAKALHKATSEFLDANKNPSRKAGELDNRGSHFYLALYWAKALSEQDEDHELNKKFSELYSELKTNEHSIISELNKIQKAPVDIGGYYHPDPIKTAAAMRPCKTLNDIILKHSSKYT